MRRMNTFSIVEMLIIVVMTFRAGLKREIHGSEILASMFCMARGAGDSGFTMCGNNSSGETFALMASGAIGIHLFPVRHTHSDRVTGSTRIAVRLFGDRRR